MDSSGLTGVAQIGDKTDTGMASDFRTDTRPIMGQNRTAGGLWSPKTGKIA